MLKKVIAWFRIPRGPYCYTPYYISGQRYRKRCPYYREFWIDDDWQNHSSYCKLLDYPYGEDWDGLLWDQCKICGIKENKNE
jgi:hypothetical protein